MPSLSHLRLDDRTRFLFAAILSIACSDTPGSNDQLGTGGSSENTGGTSHEPNENDGGAKSMGGAGSGGAPPSGGSPTTSKNTYVYVGSGSSEGDENGSVTVFRLNLDDPTLSHVRTHTAGGHASSLAIDSDNRRLFTTDEKNGGVLSFTIDPTNGDLSANGSVTSERKPTYLALANGGSYLFAANRSQGSVDVYPIAANGRAQSTIQNEPTGLSPAAIAMDGISRILIADDEADSISFFEFSSGQLVAAETHSIEYPSPRHIVFGPEGRAYVSSEESNDVTAYTFESDGSASVYWQSGRLPQGGSGAGGELRVAPSGQFVYSLNGPPSNTIAIFSSLDGLIVERSSTLGTEPVSIAIDPQGKVLIVANRTTKDLVGFTIEPDGTLDHAFTESLEVSPHSIVIADISNRQ